MRDIIFRGKRTDNGEWVCGVPTKDSHGETVMVESVYECEEYNCRGANCLYVDENTVGQYIGLTDKNGTKIFEDDIVKIKGKTRYIFYGSSGFRHTNYGEYANTLENVFTVVDCEIIGNKFDNPELLRSEKE